jgi:hypothetical protein
MAYRVLPGLKGSASVGRSGIAERDRPVFALISRWSVGFYGSKRAPSTVAMGIIAIGLSSRKEVECKRFVARST